MLLQFKHNISKTFLLFTIWLFTKLLCEIVPLSKLLEGWSSWLSCKCVKDRKSSGMTRRGTFIWCVTVGGLILETHHCISEFSLWWDCLVIVVLIYIKFTVDKQFIPNHFHVLSFSLCSFIIGYSPFLRLSISDGHGRWFYPGTPASSTTKTGRHDIAEILLKVALNTKNQSINQSISDGSC